MEARNDYLYDVDNQTNVELDKSDISLFLDQFNTFLYLTQSMGR